MNANDPKKLDRSFAGRSFDATGRNARCHGHVTPERACPEPLAAAAELVVDEAPGPDVAHLPEGSQVRNLTE